MGFPFRKIKPVYLKKLEKIEGLRLFAYPDPAQPLAKATPQLRKRWGTESALELLKLLPPEIARLSGEPWTVGFGHTGEGIGPHTSCTVAQAEAWLDEDMDWAQTAVEKLVTTYINDGQYAALVIFVFNIGVPAFKASTLLRRINAGRHAEAPKEFRKWIKVKNRQTGKYETNQGLINRRELEISIWNAEPILDLTQDLEVPVSSAGTEAVAESKPAIKSRTLIGSAVSTVGTAGSLIAETTDQLEPLAMYSNTISIIFTVLTLAGIGLVIYAKMQERKEEQG